MRWREGRAGGTSNDNQTSPLGAGLGHCPHVTAAGAAKSSPKAVAGRRRDYFLAQTTLAKGFLTKAPMYGTFELLNSLL